MIIDYYIHPFCVKLINNSPPPLLLFQEINIFSFLNLK